MAPTPDEKPSVFTHPAKAALGVLDAGASVASGLGASALGAGAGLAGAIRNAVTGEKGPTGHEVASGVMRDFTWQPRSDIGKALLGGFGTIMDRSKLAGLGPTEAMVLSGMPRVPVSTISKPKAAVAEAPKREPGAGAAKVVDEIQRQGELLESGKPVPTTGAPSPTDVALGKAQGATGQFQELLRNTPGQFDVTAALQQIDRHLGGTAIEAGERAALGRVKDAIDIAIKNAGGSPQVIQTAGGPMMVQGGKLVPAKTAAGLSIDFVDNLRQVINKEINAKDASGKPLSADTQRRLYDVQNALLKDVPEGYRKAISDIAETKGAVSGLRPEGSVAAKLTTDPAGFSALNPADKQAMVEAAFTSKTPGRALTELVRDTANNPEAAKGLREAYTDWLKATDPKTGMTKAGDVATKWAKTREAAKSSGMMTDEHIANMDKVVGDIQSAMAGGRVRRAVASVAGAVIGGMTPGSHSLTGASAARSLVESGVSTKNMKALESVLMKIAGDPEGAAALAAAPTPANVERVRAMIPADLAAVLAGPEAREQQGRRRDPLSMRPTGL